MGRAFRPGNRPRPVEETGLPLQKLSAGICKVITSVILQEEISEKSAPTKESAVAMVTEQTGRGGKAEPSLWAPYTIFNTKSLVLALQNTTTRTATHVPHYSIYIYVCVYIYICLCVYACVCVYIYLYISIVG